MPSEFPRLLNLKQLCNFLGVNESVVKRMTKDGALPPKVDKMYWSREAVEKHLADSRRPRLINQKRLAEYLGISIPMLMQYVNDGLLPPRVTKTFWDRKAVDHWLDRHSGLVQDAAQADAQDEKKPPQSLYERHKKAQNGGVSEHPKSCSNAYASDNENGRNGSADPTWREGRTASGDTM